MLGSTYKEKPINPDKGLYKGSCNRRDCQAPGATWYNSSTRAHYCRKCARKINHWSRKDEGVLLCVEVTEHEHPT